MSKSILKTFSAYLISRSIIDLGAQAADDNQNGCGRKDAK